MREDSYQCGLRLQWMMRTLSSWRKICFRTCAIEGSFRVWQDKERNWPGVEISCVRSSAQSLNAKRKSSKPSSKILNKAVVDEITAVIGEVDHMRQNLRYLGQRQIR